MAEDIEPWVIVEMLPANDAEGGMALQVGQWLFSSRDEAQTFLSTSKLESRGSWTVQKLRETPFAHMLPGAIKHLKAVAESTREAQELSHLSFSEAVAILKERYKRTTPDGREQNEKR